MAGMSRSTIALLAGLAGFIAYVVIVLIWAAAMAYSIREYLADRRDIRVETTAGPDASPVVSGPATRLR